MDWLFLVPVVVLLGTYAALVSAAQARLPKEWIKPRKLDAIVRKAVRGRPVSARWREEGPARADDKLPVSLDRIVVEVEASLPEGLALPDIDSGDLPPWWAHLPPAIRKSVPSRPFRIVEGSLVAEERFEGWDAVRNAIEQAAGDVERLAAQIPAIDVEYPIALRALAEQADPLAAAMEAWAELQLWDELALRLAKADARTIIGLDNWERIEELLRTDAPETVRQEAVRMRIRSELPEVVEHALPDLALLPTDEVGPLLRRAIDARPESVCAAVLRDALRALGADDIGGLALVTAGDAGDLAVASDEGELSLSVAEET